VEAIGAEVGADVVVGVGAAVGLGGIVGVVAHSNVCTDGVGTDFAIGDIAAGMGVGFANGFASGGGAVGEDGSGAVFAAEKGKCCVSKVAVGVAGLGVALVCVAGAEEGTLIGSFSAGRFGISGLARSACGVSSLCFGIALLLLDKDNKFNALRKLAFSLSSLAIRFPKAASSNLSSEIRFP
jgi:hypothetical protein